MICPRKHLDKSAEHTTNVFPVSAPRPAVHYLQLYLDSSVTLCMLITLLRSCVPRDQVPVTEVFSLGVCGKHGVCRTCRRRHRRLLAHRRRSASSHPMFGLLRHHPRRKVDLGISTPLFGAQTVVRWKRTSSFCMLLELTSN